MDGRSFALQASGIESGYGKVQVLWGVDLHVAPRETVVLLGANGAGKTTLLKALHGLLPVWRGEVRLAGGGDVTHQPTSRRVRQGMVYMSELGVFPDLTIEENLDTEWLHGEINVDDEAVAKILTYPNAVIGLSDGGAHVQFQSGYGFSTRLLGEWVREKGVMTLEQAVRRLTFESASIFGLYDRGLLRPGMVADIVIFDPDTVKPLPLEVLHDFPTGAKRIKEPDQGIHMTIVNGQVLLEEGKHSGALPGRVLRNSYYRAQHA